MKYLKLTSLGLIGGGCRCLAAARDAGEITGSPADDHLTGRPEAEDVFDSDGGGNDALYGFSGNDTYRLGAGTDHDIIREAFRPLGETGDAGDTIKIKKGYTAENTRIRRSRDGRDLLVELLNAGGMVTDSLRVEDYYRRAAAKIERVEFMEDGAVWGAEVLDAAAITGGAGDDLLFGLEKFNDVFDSDAGGNDRLIGGSGSDIYLLGAGTDHDVISEDNGGRGDPGDTIRVKSGHAPANTRLRRSDNGYHLIVMLLNDEGAVTDSLTVKDHYVRRAARIERVEFEDHDTVWTAKDFAAAPITGGAGHDKLRGHWGMDDVFDSDAGGNDTLSGKSGNDTYWLGAGTGHDTIRERFLNDWRGDSRDTIKIKEGYSLENTRLRRSDDGADLHVELLNAAGEVTDSLIAEDYYRYDAAKVERLEFADGAALNLGAAAAAAALGSDRDDHLRGRQNINDILYGNGGNDVYWFGAGAGHDVIRELPGNGGDADDRIKLKSGYTADNVRLRRSDDGDDLRVELQGAAGEVTDSLTVKNYYRHDSAKVERLEFADGAAWDAEDFALAEITGGAGNDYLFGLSGIGDVFDADAGGNDTLYGKSGDDIYRLGAGAGHDVISEVYTGYSHLRANGGDANDAIIIKSGYAPGDARLRRSDDGWNLHVELLNKAGAVTDSLTVEDYYWHDSAKVERVEFADGTVWEADDFALAEITGGAEDDVLESAGGRNDVFDADAGGNDVLRGYGGDDIYRLGAGTGHDVIREYYLNGGDANDSIIIKSGYAPGDARLRRAGGGRDLQIQLLNKAGEVTDSLTVEEYYMQESAKVESVAFADGTIWRAADFAAAEITGGAGDDILEGAGSRSDVFDADAGGNDILRGGGGGDLYLFGRGSGSDTIDEGSRNFGGGGDDAVRLKAGIAASAVALSRNAFDLVISLKDSSGKITDALTVKNYYASEAAKIERVELNDGALLWGREDFAGVVWTPPAHAESEEDITGGAGDEELYGKENVNDVFDSDRGGKDILHGKSGNDVYWLGAGTGDDVIREDYDNSGGDAGDKIMIRSVYSPGGARLRRSDDGRDLQVALLNSAGAVTDSLTVEKYYTEDAAKIESAEFEGGLIWTAADFALAEITGGAGDDALSGLSSLNDVFDADAGGNDTLAGGGGDDVYRLGAGTGHDIIQEGADGSDTNDTIAVKSGYAPAEARLRRSDDGRDLQVALLNDEGAVTDSLTVQGYYTEDAAKVERVTFADGTVWHLNALAPALEITGGAGDDALGGADNLSDIFDSDAGGNDVLRGGSGGDVYRLGAGTGHDVIEEEADNDGDAHDTIAVKSGYAPANARLRRSDDGRDLQVALLNAEGAAADSLTVKDYYVDDFAKVERVTFADGTVWHLNALAPALEITGGAGDDTLYGADNLSDIFDSDAGGSDTLRGGSGNDVYWLGAGTGADVIDEIFSGFDADAGDKIKIKSGTALTDLRLRRAGEDLLVERLSNGAVTDSLTVKRQFALPDAGIESIEAAGHVLLENQFQALIDELAAFSAGESSYDSLSAIHSRYWDETTALAASNS